MRLRHALFTLEREHAPLSTLRYYFISFTCHARHAARLIFSPDHRRHAAMPLLILSLLLLFADYAAIDVSPRYAATLFSLHTTRRYADALLTMLLMLLRHAAACIFYHAATLMMPRYDISPRCYYAVYAARCRYFLIALPPLSLPYYDADIDDDHRDTLDAAIADAMPVDTRALRRFHALLFRCYFRHAFSRHAIVCRACQPFSLFLRYAAMSPPLRR